VEEFFFFYLNIQPTVPSPGYKIIFALGVAYYKKKTFSAGIQVNNQALLFHGILQDSPVSEADRNNCGTPQRDKYYTRVLIDLGKYCESVITAVSIAPLIILFIT